MATTTPAAPNPPRDTAATDGPVLPASSAVARVLALSCVLAVAAVVTYFVCIMHARWVPARVHVPWPVLAAAFGMADLFVIHAEVRDDAHSFTLNELPLVIGLFFSTPQEIVLARVVAAIAVAVLQRDVPIKAFFNVALAALGVVLAVAVLTPLRAVLGTLQTPVGWLVVLTTAAAVNAVDALAVSAAIRCVAGDSGDRQVGRMVTLGLLTSSATTSVGLMTAIVLQVEPTAMMLVAVVAAVLFVAYRGYAVLHRRYDGLQQLYELTKALCDLPELEASVQLTFSRTCDLLRAGDAELVLLEWTGDLHGAARLRIDPNGRLQTSSVQGVRDAPDVDPHRVGPASRREADDEGPRRTIVARGPELQRSRARPAHTRRPRRRCAGRARPSG